MSFSDYPKRPASAAAPRLLMTRLRSMMAQDQDITTRLARVVEMIATSMVADVCSIYLRLEDGSFELVATEGLKPEAVGRTRLEAQEGLIGYVAKRARALRVQDAPHHPNFSYRPETGEDPYHAFLGVPVLRGGRVVGVLAVQNVTARVYDDEEVETLQTIAMVLAEMVASETSAEDGGLKAVAMRPRGPRELSGRGLSDGIAIGKAHLHDPIVAPAQFFVSDTDAEKKRLEGALSDLRSRVDDMMIQQVSPLSGESRDILETYRLLAHDPSWAARLMEAVSSGLSAEAAVDRARREHRARLESVTDNYLRERLHDLEDLDNRLLRLLSGNETVAADGDLNGSVLIARRLGPADLLEYRNAGLEALVLEEATSGSHAVIVARALGLPTVSGVQGLMPGVDEDDDIIVDASTGIVHIRPAEDVSSLYKDRLALRSQKLVEFAAIRDLDAVTQDGEKITLMMNAGLELDLDNLDPSGAAGIGLFRTEFQFLVSERLPRLEEQIAFYSAVLDRAGDRPVLFRTIDLGGDKLMPSMRRDREENPSLGWRSLRLALDRPGLFRRQLRALMIAADKRPLSVMFPMVTTCEEYRQARKILLKEYEVRKRRGHGVPSDLKTGAMIETPAFGEAFVDIAEELDFVSIGTNDLHQYFFAADRNNRHISDRYPFAEPSFLRFLMRIRERADQLNIPISICGEAAGRLHDALALVMIGFRRLSMPASGIGPVKQMIRSLNVESQRENFFNALNRSEVCLNKELLSVIADT